MKDKESAPVIWLMHSTRWMLPWLNWVLMNWRKPSDRSLSSASLGRTCTQSMSVRAIS